MSQKKIVITGGGGLIGSHLSTQILAAGHECTSVVRPGSRSGRDAADGPATGLNQVELDLDRSGAVAESECGGDRGAAGDFGAGRGADPGVVGVGGECDTGVPPVMDRQDA